MSDTPRMEAAASQGRVADIAILVEGMKLERELKAANDRIKQLERLAADVIKLHRPDIEAKEVKP